MIEPFNILYFAVSTREPVAIGADWSKGDLSPVTEIAWQYRGMKKSFLLQRDDIITYGAEIDSESVEYLHAHYPDFAPRLSEGDFLKMDLRACYGQRLKIIGNFPYNISSQIFFKVLDYRESIPCCTGMIQREVAQRIAAGPGSKTYGILSVLLQVWYDIEYLFTVDEDAFTPPPKVKSAVVRLVRNKRTAMDCNEKLFKTVVKTTFNRRRKMLRNSVKPLIGENTEVLQNPIFTKRPEQLSVAQFV